MSWLTRVSCLSFCCRAVPWPCTAEAMVEVAGLQPGDLVAHHSECIHVARDNSSEDRTRVRRLYSIRSQSVVGGSHTRYLGFPLSSVVGNAEEKSPRQEGTPIRIDLCLVCAKSSTHVVPASVLCALRRQRAFACVFRGAATVLDDEGYARYMKSAAAQGSGGVE